jgi:hypothetical protein
MNQLLKICHDVLTSLTHTTPLSTNNAVTPFRTVTEQSLEVNLRKMKVETLTKEK